MDTQLRKKYRPYPQVSLPQRQWTDKRIASPPIWCSVDLRDGNQALVQPMSIEEKIEMYRLILEMGGKEIEVGFPSASQVEFDFTRRLIENDLIPDGVVIQVLTQARELLIKRIFFSVEGSKRGGGPFV